MELPESVVQAREAASQAQQASGALGAMEPTISDVLRQKITEAYASNQDIVKPLDIATTEYLGAPMAAREKYQNIFNPFQRENLVQQYQGNKALPMLMYSNMMGNRLNTAEDIIGAGTRGFQAQVAAAQAAATQAQQYYTNLLNEYELTKEAEADTQVVNANGRQLLVNSSTGDLIADLGEAPAGSGGTNVIISGIDVAGGKFNQNPKESKPSPGPYRSGQLSKGGQWVFNTKYYDWVPANATNIVD
jgi:hypothetical protein